MKIRLTAIANKGYFFYKEGETVPTDITGLELVAYQSEGITYVTAGALHAEGFANFPEGMDFSFQPYEFEVIEE